VATLRWYNELVSPVLKVGPDEASEEAEIDFELAYLATLTTAQRFEMMFSKSREIAQELLRRGHRGPAQIVKRT
jgi:hypothetical protein